MPSLVTMNQLNLPSLSLTRSSFSTANNLKAAASGGSPAIDVAMPGGAETKALDTQYAANNTLLQNAVNNSLSVAGQIKSRIEALRQQVSDAYGDQGQIATAINSAVSDINKLAASNSKGADAAGAYQAAQFLNSSSAAVSTTLTVGGTPISFKGGNLTAAALGLNTVASGAKVDVDQLNQTLTAARSTTEGVINQLMGNSAQVGSAITYLQTRIDFHFNNSGTANDSGNANQSGQANKSASGSLPPAAVPLAVTSQAATDLLRLIRG